AEYESSLAGVEDEEPRTGSPGAAAVAAAAAPAPIEKDEPAGDGTLGLVVPAAAAVAATTGSGRAPSRDDPSAPGETIRAPIPPAAAGAGTALAPTASAPTRAGSAGAAGRGGIRTPWLIGGAILALALLIGAVGVYLLLPSATIAVTPKQEPVG